jgi:transposase
VRPERLAGDKGYRSPRIWRHLKGRRIAAVIPAKANEAPNPTFDRMAYRERNVVEGRINRLKLRRRVATRYEKRAANSRAMVTLACTML